MAMIYKTFIVVSIPAVASDASKSADRRVMRQGSKKTLVLRLVILRRPRTIEANASRTRARSAWAWAFSDPTIELSNGREFARCGTLADSRSK